MRWGLVPSWWSKPLKELRLATFNVRAETVAEKPFFQAHEALAEHQRSDREIAKPRFHSGLRVDEWGTGL